MQENIWKIKAKAPIHKSQNWLTLLLAKNRELTTKEKLNRFLNPKLADILKISLSDTQKAIERIKKAVKNRQKIIVYSDYDADGICATAIMWETLYDLGAQVLPYVPHRIKEGYGLSNPAIDKLAKKGVKLIITVDQGVTANDQVAHAKSLGLDVVITDHHILPKKLPQAHALVHTTDLCGAGVAWRLCWEIVKKLSPSYKERLVEKLELAALATIADLVPLLSANRAIVKIGLEKLQKTRRPGIKALVKSSGFNSQVGTYEIGHILAPRINAMGRLEHAMDSLRLLCAKNQKQAQELAQLLSKTNSKRQDLTKKAITHAMQMVDGENQIGIISHHLWHEGIIGLVAARLVETHHKPMIVISRGEVYSKGSARSVPGFNIVEAIRSSSELLVDAGGHPMAAGFTIETKYIEEFTKRLTFYAQSQISGELLKPIINIECELDKNDINGKTLTTIKLFEPYGVSNPQPVFLTRKMLVEDVRCVGATGQHLKLQLDGFGAIGFNMGGIKTEMRPGYLVDLVYILTEDNYNDNGKLQLKIKDLAIAPN